MNEDQMTILLLYLSLSATAQFQLSLLASLVFGLNGGRSNGLFSENGQHMSRLVAVPERSWVVLWALRGPELRSSC